MTSQVLSGPPVHAVTGSSSPTETGQSHSTLLARDHGEHTRKIPGRARQWALDHADALGYGPTSTLVDNLELIVAELVTNAVKYAQGPVHLTLSRECSGELRLVVRDNHATEKSTPAMVLHDSTEAADKTHGRGLWIVQQLSTSWGVERSGTGHLVWSRPSPKPPEEPW